MAKTIIMDHPLIQHKIGIIRRKEVGNTGISSDHRGDCHVHVL